MPLSYCNVYETSSCLSMGIEGLIQSDLCLSLPSSTPGGQSLSQWADLTHQMGCLYQDTSHVLDATIMFTRRFHVQDTVPTQLESAYLLLGQHKDQKSSWYCISTAEQQVKHGCAINSELTNNPKHSTIAAAVKKINSNPDKTNRTL